MAVLNVTLNNLKFANTDGFLRDFGTKKTRDQNGGSLTTRECNENVAKIFDTQRPFYVLEDSETSNIEFSATFVISNGVKLTLGEGSFPGVEVKILSGDNSAVIAGQKEYILPLNGFTKFFWTGTSWNYTSFSPTQSSVASINSNDEFPIMQDGETKKTKIQTLAHEVLKNRTTKSKIYKETVNEKFVKTYNLNDFGASFAENGVIKIKIHGTFYHPSETHVCYTEHIVTTGYPIIAAIAKKTLEVSYGRYEDYYIVSANTETDTITIETKGIITKMSICFEAI